MTTPQNLPATPAERQAVYRRALLLRLLSDVIKEETDEARAAAEQLMAALDSERVSVRDDAGTVLGRITRSEGRKTAVVVDERAFVEWMQRKHPTEVETRVREATRRRLLSEMARLDAPVDTLAGDGEVVPGVEIRYGSPYITIYPNDEARLRIADLLAGSGLLELTASPDGDSDA